MSRVLLQSYRRAQAAAKAGHLKAEMLPITIKGKVVDVDEVCWNNITLTTLIAFLRKPIPHNSFYAGRVQDEGFLQAAQA
jgi:hypothetical protein